MLNARCPLAAALLPAASASPAPAESPATAVAPPGAFTLSAPVDGAANVSRTPTLTWTASASGPGGGAVGFSGSTGGSCGLPAQEWLAPWGAVWFARRRLRKG